MMIDFIFDFKEDARKLTNFREKGFNRILKIAMKAAMLNWHRTSLPKHFERSAYFQYRGFPRAKRGAGRPMFVKGDFRSRILARKGESDVRGTIKSLRLRMKYGRPALFTEEAIKRAIYAQMEMNPGMSFKQAERKVYSSAGYGARAKAIFERAIPAMNEKDIQRFLRVVRRRMVFEFNKRPVYRRRRIK